MPAAALVVALVIPGTAAAGYVLKCLLSLSPWAW